MKYLPLLLAAVLAGCYHNPQPTYWQAYTQCQRLNQGMYEDYNGERFHAHCDIQAKWLSAPHDPLACTGCNVPQTVVISPAY